MKILLAYDGFDHSRKALDEVIELAGSDKASVTVVSVVPESEARATKAGGHRWLAPHAHQDVANAHRFLREHGIELPSSGTSRFLTGVRRSRRGPAAS